MMIAKKAPSTHMRPKSHHFIFALIASHSAIAQIAPSLQPSQSAESTEPAKLKLTSALLAGNSPADATAPNVTSVLFSGNTAMSSSVLEPLVASLTGKPQSLAEMRVAASAVTTHYREAGYFLARAYIPPQEMKDGVLTIAVLEGTLADVKLENTSLVSDARVRDYLAGLKAGAPANRAEVDRAAFLLQDLPGIAEADARVAAGREPGTTTFGTPTTGL